MNQKILSIHYLRGIAALLVVFFHFRFYLNDVYVQKDLGNLMFGGGAFGVDLFFMISGFIIAASTKFNRNVKSFIIKRVFRVYPAFFFVFVIGALTVYSNYSLHELLKAMLFLHIDYSLSSPTFGFNILGPAWTLTYEVYFYSIFIISLLLNPRYRIALCSLLIIIPFLIVQLTYTGGVSLAASGSPAVPVDTVLFPLIRFVGSPIILEFVIGMWLYLAFTSDLIKLSKRASKSIFTLCIFVFLSFYFNENLSHFGLTGFGIGAIIILFASLVYEKTIGISENKTLSFLGDISYSLYISHYIVIKMIKWHSFVGISKFIIVGVICIAIATLIHFYIEKPFIALGKKLDSYYLNKNTVAKSL